MEMNEDGLIVDELSLTYSNGTLSPLLIVPYGIT